MNFTDIGIRIKRARKNKKLTQRELAKTIKKTESSIRKYEKGLVEIPYKTLEQIATTLEIDLFDLIQPEVAPLSAEEELQLLKDNQRQAEDDYLRSLGIEPIADIENELRNHFYRLNTIGKQEAVKRVQELTEIPRYTQKDEPTENSAQ